MTRHSPWLVYVALVLCGGMFPSALRAADEAATKELQATIEKYIAAYNAGTVGPVMDFWAQNADFVDSHGRMHEGRDLIAALFRRGFASNPGRKLSFALETRKFLAPDIAMDDGVLEFTSPDGDKDRGRYTVIWTKVNGNWLIRSARDIPLEDASPATSDRPALDELSWLLGRWESKSDKHQITLDCDQQLGNNFLVQRFLVKSADEEDFQVVTWTAYDPTERRFQSWYFDSRGGFGGGPWTKRDNVWRIAVTAVLPDGQSGSSIMTWEQVDANTIRWRAIDREVEGHSVPDAEKLYTRASAPAAAARQGR